MSFGRSIVLLLFGVLTGLTTQAGPSVTLAWSASTAAGVIGYRLYQGQASQNYNTVTDAGGMTNLTITGLLPGKTYYFTVTAYETGGVESAFSTEISYTVPLTGATLQIGITTGHRVVLGGTAPAANKYNVESTPGLSGSSATNWVAIGNLTVGTNGLFQFTDPGSATNRTRFYRLRQTYP